MTTTLTNDKAAALDALQDPAVIERFTSKVDRRSPAECWEWTAGLSNGYGMFKLQGRPRRAHRVAWALAHGETVPEDLVVRHRCDNPPCVNPAHLELGTVADNIRDKVERGRQARGEDNGRAVLTEAQVAEARSRVRVGETTTAVARDLGVRRDTLREAVRGITWPGEVLGEAPVPAVSRERRSDNG